MASYCSGVCLVICSFALLCAGSPTTEPKLWAVLVAGSNGYYNYRHQADICHAYQIMKRNGIPDERIIVMMYNDIAHSSQNPTPGVVINRPNGPDVFKGVKMDYQGEDVTPENFLNVLTGNKKAMLGIGSGKVLESGPNDHVFINFADHGGPGLIGFPSDTLSARSLNKALKKMYASKMYAKMLFYMEACESGSMFKKLLPKDVNVYATTAANGQESSYACYYDTKRQTYLGDVYSVKWMEDSDKEDLKIETLIKQFKIVRSETNTSHVQEFGDLSIGKLAVAEFQGLNPKPAVSDSFKMDPTDVVDSRDVPIAILENIIKTTTVRKDRVLARRALRNIRKKRLYLKTKVLEIVQKIVKNIEELDKLWTSNSELNNLDCYEEAVSHFHKNCFSLGSSEYALAYMQKLVNVCEHGIQLDHIKSAMDEMCAGPKLYTKII